MSMTNLLRQFEIGTGIILARKKCMLYPDNKIPNTSEPNQNLVANLI
jgi:hypothetical protein